MKVSVVEYMTKFLCVMLSVILFSCNTDNKQSTPLEKQTTKTNNETQENWINEEILNQLTSLRKEVKQLSTQVTKLSQSVEELKKGKVTSNALTVPLNSSRSTGSKNATIAVVEFANFECPYCVRFSQITWPKIKKEFVDTGKVQFHAYDFPLGNGRRSIEAAIATRCADEQNKYLEMRGMLYTSSQNLNQDLYIKAAQSLGLDNEQYRQCLAEPAQIDAVKRDIALGNKIGVTGTPRFYIGRVVGDQLTDVTVLSGAKNFAAFASVIRAYL